MQKKKLKLREHHFHLIGQTLSKEKFPLELSHFWDVLILQLNTLTLSFRIRVRCLVLMGNHFHLIISSYYDDPNLICRSLKEGIDGLAEQAVMAEIFSSEIKHPIYYQYVYKYIYRNPVSAGLCAQVEKYPWSSLHNVLGKKSELFLLFDNMNLIHDPQRMLKWLNEPIPYPPEIEELNQLFNELSF